MINEIENCAYCKGFPCEELLKAHSVQQITNRDEFIKKTGKDISEQDYRFFIEPYAGLFRLNKVRQTIPEKDFKDFKTFSTRIKLADFNSAIEGQESFKKIYSILTTICVEKNIPYARLQTIEYQREQFIKILWAAGNFGIFNKSHGYIELDSNTFMNQKIHGMFYNVLLEYISDFKKYDILCEIVPLVKKGWQTPLGGLRKEGWVFRLRFGDLLGTETLQVFKDYTTRLNTKYGNKAFKIFNTADLSIMTN
jgi:Histone deacetylase complex, SIN3 component